MLFKCFSLFFCICQGFLLLVFCYFLKFKGREGGGVVTPILLPSVSASVLQHKFHTLSSERSIYIIIVVI